MRRLLSLGAVAATVATLSVAPAASANCYVVTVSTAQLFTIPNVGDTVVRVCPLPGE